MKKATEATASNEKAGKSLKFEQLCKEELRQDTVHDFVSYTTDGNFITLIGTKTELLTLELSSKSTYQMPFPYIVASTKCCSDKRPLDHLSLKVNLQNIYESSNVLEMHQMSLEPAYTAVCSEVVPLPKIVASRLSPQSLPGGEMLLASLNSYGAMQFFIKSPEQATWREYEQGVNVAVTLRDTLLPPYEMQASRIKTFAHFQAFIDRSWIKMFAWRPVVGKCVLVLGTAAGSIWTLTLSLDLQSVLAHCQLQTLLGRICYMHILDDLLLVGDNSGLVHLYRFSDAAEEGLCLVKTLWLRPDKMGLQQALITHCQERDCYYIACCKATHLLIWCMPRKDDGDWLETRLHAGGMKVTALCALEDSNYALATARGELYRIELTHKSGQLSASMRSIEMEDTENLQPVGLCSSPHNNLLTVLFTRNKEYVLNTTQLRHHLEARLGRLQESDALAQLEVCLSPNKCIGSCNDLLVEIRLDIFNDAKREEFVNYAPLDMIAFDELATESQQQQLQIKYHVLDAIMQAQRNQPNDLPLQQSECQMQLLLAMLSLTHMRLRLQYLSSLPELTVFQRQATECQLAESARIRQQLEQQSVKEHPLNATLKRFLAQMEVHFEVLQLKLGVPQPAVEDTQQQQLCNVSYMQLEQSLERHYCSLCGRQALLERELLLKLYAPGSTLLCPCCHGKYNLELLDA